MGMSEYFDSVWKWFEGQDTEIIDKCIICGEKNYKFDIQKNKWPLAVCNHCGFVWRYIAPLQSTLDKFYEESEAMKQWSEIKQSDAERKRQKEKYDFVYQHIDQVKPSAILDVGCGNGFFLNNCVTEARKVGIEPHAQSASFCKFPTYPDFETFNNSIHSRTKFDLITFFGVMEHLKDPVGTIKQYSKFLSPRGCISIIVPNYDSLVVKTLKQDCSTFCPQHLWYYTFTTLSLLMASNGFDMGMSTTVEPESMPIMKHMNGIDPYSKEKLEIKYPQEIDDGIINNGLGYKLVTLYSKEII